MKKKTLSQIFNRQKKRLQEVLDALNELHFLSMHEILAIVKKLKYAPPKAFKEIMAAIKEAKAKQNDFLAKAIKHDPEYVEKLEEALKKNYKYIIKEMTEKESTDAEHILDQIYQ